MSPFEQWIQRKQSFGCRDRAIGAIGALVVADQFGKGLHRFLVKTPALGRHPLFESLSSEAEAIEQLALVERDRVLERLRGSFSRKPLESQGVHFQCLRIEPH